MAIDTDYIKQQSAALAQYEVARALAQTQRNEAKYKAQLEAVTALEMALQSFGTAIKDLAGSGSMLINSAVFSKEGMASASVGPTASEGSYQFFVRQLASTHQVALDGLSDDSIDTTGKLTIGQGSESFEIDLSQVDTDGDGKNSQEELAAAINAASDNTGVKATLVRSGGEVTFVLSSEKSGKDHQIELSTDGLNPGGALETAIDGKKELSPALDAIVLLGGENGKVLTNSSNTFDDLIDGVSLTFSKVHSSGDEPLTVDISRDNAATKEKIQGFVTAVNALMSSFDSLTASGGASGERGDLAGDTSIRSIESMLNSVLRTEHGGASLMAYGIVADKNGQLTIDTKSFEKALEANPEAFEKLFTDKGNLLDSLETNLSGYTSGINGTMKVRKESLSNMLQRVDKQYDVIQTQYDAYYARYIKQFTNMSQVMAQMEQTYSLFG